MNQFQLKNLLYHVIALESLYLSYHDFCHSHDEISHFCDQNTFMTLIIQWNNCEYFNNVFIYSYEFMDPFLYYVVRSQLVLFVPSLFANWEMKHENIVKIKSDLTRNFLFSIFFFHAFTRKKASFKSKNLIVGTVLPPIQEIL